MQHAFTNYDIFEHQIKSIVDYTNDQHEDAIREYIKALMEQIRKCIESSIECHDKCIGREIHIKAFMIDDFYEVPTTELIVRACLNEIRRCTGLHLSSTVLNYEHVVIKYSLDVPTISDILKNVHY